MRCLVGRIKPFLAHGPQRNSDVTFKKRIHVSVSEEVGRNSVCEFQNKRLPTSLSEEALINNDT
jgi:hypothetical protein